LIAGVGAALQIYYTRFDAAFLKLPASTRARIESKIDEMGLRLGTFPHHHLTGSNRYRLRIGDYRVIYNIDDSFHLVEIIAVRHRSKAYD